MNETIWIIIAAAIATYLTRVGGYLVLSRFETVHPRIESALNAVPAAVLTTLVAPSLLSAGPREMIALVVAGLVALRGGIMTMFITGAVVLILLRNFT
ncbi:MAG: AzlD family protein [Mesorhizobium sp.]